MAFDLISYYSSNKSSSNNHIVGPRPNLQQVDQILMRQPWGRTPFSLAQRNGYDKTREFILSIISIKSQSLATIINDVHLPPSPECDELSIIRQAEPSEQINTDQRSASNKSRMF